MGVGGGTFPQSASRDDEEGDWLCECVFACLHERACVSVCVLACVKEEPYSDLSFSSSEVRSLCPSASCPLSVCLWTSSIGEQSDESPRASTQLVHRHQDCMKMMLKLLVTQLL